MVAPAKAREDRPLLPDREPANSASLQLEAFCLYRSLMRDEVQAAAGDQQAEPGLGGQLLYVGELDDHSRAMVIAANVAGCASLAVSANPISQKQAMRAGEIDFVVISLDEALRILKNEIRKQNRVAVSVTAEPAAMNNEMLARGVAPDLVFAGARDEPRQICRFGSAQREVYLERPDADAAQINRAQINWQVEQAPTQWMQRLDAIAMECLAEDKCARHWLRIAPRYLGRGAQGYRAFCCEEPSAHEIARRFEESVRSGVIATRVSLGIRIAGESSLMHFVPDPTV